MALDESRLAEAIMDEMEALGLNPRNPLSGGSGIKIYTAIAKAVVAEIQSNSEVVIAGGSSSGTYTVS